MSVRSASLTAGRSRSITGAARAVGEAGREQMEDTLSDIHRMIERRRRNDAYDTLIELAARADSLAAQVDSEAPEEPLTEGSIQNLDRLYARVKDALRSQIQERK